MPSLVSSVAGNTGLCGSPHQLLASNEGDLCAHLRTTFEHEFAKLQKWLDVRLRYQEELLERLNKTPTGEPVRDRHVPVPLPMSVPRPFQLEHESSVPSPPDDVAPLPKIEAPRREADWELMQAGTASPTAELSRQESPYEKSKPPMLGAWESIGSDGDTVRLQDWLSRLMDVFDEIDLDGSGTIDRNEMSEAFLEVGIPPIQAFQAFTRIDQSTNGEIDRLEWLHIIEQGSKDDEDVFVNFAKKVVERHVVRGRIYDARRQKRLYVIRHTSAPRVVWDILLMCFVFYIAVSLPFMMGFGEVEALNNIDVVLDFWFLVDVVLNFFTTYIDREDCMVVNNRKIAMHYLQTWFLMDFISSVPWEIVTAGIMPNLQPARLLKIGKIAKVFKLLRIGKMFKMLAGSELMEYLEDKYSKRGNQTVLRIGLLSVSTSMLCHWLACFMAYTGSRGLDLYLDNDQSQSRRYLAAVYWAMMTLTTVGYGDIVPASDAERVYAMAAMIIGGIFYGYIIGCMTSIISDMDLNTRAYAERMELVHAWLDYHGEIPKVLRRRIRRHFKSHLSNKTAVDDTSIVKDLSPDLRADAAYFLIHEEVRCNPVFRELPNSALASLLDIFEKTNAEPGDCLVRRGDPGMAMYVIIDGRAYYREGARWVPSAADASAELASSNGLRDACGADGCTAPQPPPPLVLPGCAVCDYEPQPAERRKSPALDPVLKTGDSFGEEIIFGFEETYRYTISARTAVSMYILSEDNFQNRFKNLPILRQQMMDHFIRHRLGR
eukprot:TRINITY_DN24588_c0_g2_i2.p1 TRINITY_DN24588_c0_g2~~TRINITY_DN24588_c0_g2_i2.p1  ORF type:complete len:773 (+),score=122.89 TRINITY_DN24588_c0_g2_i2:40-2358(+)